MSGKCAEVGKCEVNGENVIKFRDTSSAEIVFEAIGVEANKGGSHAKNVLNRRQECLGRGCVCNCLLFGEYDTATRAIVYNHPDVEYPERGSVTKKKAITIVEELSEAMVAGGRCTYEKGSKKHPLPVVASRRILETLIKS